MRNRIIEDDLTFIANSDLRWELLAGKTVLITGAAGFLTTYLVESLLHLKEVRNISVNVLALARNRKKAWEKFGEHIAAEPLTLVVQDVCDPISFKGKIDFIVHAASQASPKYYGKDPVGTLLPNVLGTANLLKLAVDKNVKGFLFFSSGEVYGHVSSSQMPIREDLNGHIDPLDVRSCYAESKRMGETMCVSWMHQYGVPVKIARIFHTYGPGMSLNDGRVFADFVSDIVKGHDIVMNSDGSASRCFCYISDTIAALFAVLLKGEAGEAYNIGNDEAEITIIDLANLLGSLFPERQLRVIRRSTISKPGYLKSPFNRQTPDTKKIRKLGWSPRINLRDGFKRTVESFL